MTIAANHPNEQRIDAVRNHSKILKAVRQLLATGNQTLSMNGVAKQARMGVGTVYRHFPTRHALLVALGTEALEELIIVVQNVTGIEDYIQKVSDYLCDQIGLIEVLQSDQQIYPHTFTLQAKLQSLNETLLTQAQKEHKVRSDISAKDLHNLLCVFMMAAQTAQNPETRELYSTVLLRGISP